MADERITAGEAFNRTKKLTASERRVTNAVTRRSRGRAASCWPVRGLCEPITTKTEATCTLRHLTAKKVWLYKTVTAHWNGT